MFNPPRGGALRYTASSTSLRTMNETRSGRAIGHLRRMRSDETIRLFEHHGVAVKHAFYSNQFIGWVDWLVRGHDHATIDSMFEICKATSRLAKAQLLAVQKSLRVLNRISGWSSIDLRKKRTLPKAVLARVAKAGRHARC